MTRVVAIAIWVAVTNTWGTVWDSMNTWSGTATPSQPSASRSAAQRDGSGPLSSSVATRRTLIAFLAFLAFPPLPPRSRRQQARAVADDAPADHPGPVDSHDPRTAQRHRGSHPIVAAHAPEVGTRLGDVEGHVGTG